LEKRKGRRFLFTVFREGKKFPLHPPEGMGKEELLITILYSLHIGDHRGKSQSFRVAFSFGGGGREG